MSLEVHNVSKPRICPQCRTPNSFYDTTENGSSFWKCRIPECQYLIQNKIVETDRQMPPFSQKSSFRWSKFIGFIAIITFIIVFAGTILKYLNEKNNEENDGVVTSSFSYKPIPVQDILISSSIIWLEMGERYQLSANISPSNADAEIMYTGYGIDVSDDGMISAPSYKNLSSGNTYHVDVTAGGVSKSITVHVSNSYSWEWYDDGWDIDGVPTSVMALETTITDCTGFTLGVKLDEGSLEDWSIYVYTGDGGYINAHNKVGSVIVSSVGEWTYANVSFSERDVCWILIQPPVDSSGDWNGWTLYADLTKIVYDGYVH